MSTPIKLPRLSASKIRELKGKRRLHFLTSYEYWTAAILDECQIDGILVGDSLAQIIQGRSSTLPVTLDEIIYHAKAVRKGAPNTFIIADMPFMSTQVSVEETLKNCGRVLKETDVNAIKLEGYEPEKVLALTKAGIPVMAHLGLTPQSINVIGSYSKQAKTDGAASELMRSCLDLSNAGAFAIVLECIPYKLSLSITKSIEAITVGIGAGPDTDAQILVLHDLLGFGGTDVPKFVRPTLNGRELVSSAIDSYIDRTLTENKNVINTLKEGFF